MKAFSLLILFVLIGCASGERGGGQNTPTYGRYDLKIQVFHSESVFDGEVFECVDLVYGERVNLQFVDRSDIGGKKYYEGQLNVSSNSEIECHDTSQILFTIEEVAPRKIAVWSYVPFNTTGFGQDYFIRVSASFYQALEYAPVYEAK
ncbi:hypothetical protein [Bdellovibrio bacteriovorus]|uniref:hypothetical protein n=1 Tax=Bdellovibrio bacteriovorus TaxID=959 RepID=UPI003AA83134